MDRAGIGVRVCAIWTGLVAGIAAALAVLLALAPPSQGPPDAAVYGLVFLVALIAFGIAVVSGASLAGLINAQPDRARFLARWLLIPFVLTFAICVIVSVCIWQGWIPLGLFVGWCGWRARKALR